MPYEKFFELILSCDEVESSQMFISFLIDKTKISLFHTSYDPCFYLFYDIQRGDGCLKSAAIV